MSPPEVTTGRFGYGMRGAAIVLVSISGTLPMCGVSNGPVTGRVLFRRVLIRRLECGLSEKAAETLFTQGIAGLLVMWRGLQMVSPSRRQVTITPRMCGTLLMAV